MNQTQILLLCICGAFFLIVALIAAIGDHYSLKGIPNKPVGNGQHGTARFATKGRLPEHTNISPTHLICGAMVSNFRAWTV